MNCDQANVIFDEIRKAAEVIAAKHGCAIAPPEFNSKGYTLKLGLIDLQDAGKPADFNFNAFLVNLPRDCFGKTFVYNGATYKVVDIVPRRNKYPVTVEDKSGKPYKFPLDIVRKGIGA